MATISVSKTTELQSALKKGGTIEMEPATYILKSATIPKSDTQFVSANPDKGQPIILMQANHPSGPMLNGYNVDGIAFENICLDGNFANQRGAKRGSSSLVLCWLRNGEDITMRNCTVRNSAIDGLKLAACDNILVEGNTVHDLGHEFVYAMYDCEDLVFRNNNVKTRTNSAMRGSYGGSNFKIYNNTIWSEIASWSTGPGMEFDKEMFSNIEIYDNTIKDLNGSGIWFSADIASCKNVNIHDNIFDNVGNFLNGKFDYNGYSNAGIAGAGMDGMVIENNVFKNIKLGYAVLMAEAKHAVPGKYEWIFRNNKLINVNTGFRISNSRGSLSGSGNSYSCVKSFSNGVTGNVKVNTGSESPAVKPTDPITPVTPIENTEGTTEVKKVASIKSTVIAMGAKGKLLHVTHDDKPATEMAVASGTTYDVTVKLLTDTGMYGEGKVSIPLVKR